ncbi:hypothetical protein AB0M39_21790 [Streptomyces sp. NPDC051907]|uniref:hypothetical protein n=1 Tax=Streptomyces sp. NPDC051907 TaxID=3155284 RepID=UPI003434F13D
MDEIPWRIRKYLGISRGTNLQKDYELQPSQQPCLIAIDDACLGFSDDADLWEDLIEKFQQQDEATPWLLIKLKGESVARSKLWKRLSEWLEKRGSCPERLIVLTHVDSLRDAGAEVSRGLSWERSTQDVLAALKGDSPVRTLGLCQRLIVSFGPVGAMLIEQEARTRTATLFFGPEMVEGTWERRNPGGWIFGYSQVLAAAIIKSMKEAQILEGRTSEINLHEVLSSGIRRGISAMRSAYTDGFSAHPDGQLKFPLHCLNAGESVLGEVHTEDRQANPKLQWSILGDSLSGEDADPYSKAESVAKKGPGAPALQNIPHGEFGALLTVDRGEMEGLRTIQNLISEYWQAQNKLKPRSIAVFGAPGSGKSFAVKQVVKSMQGEPKEPLEFNLSQFDSVDELTDAFHQVRDRCLKGEVPLVFWDEFDTPFHNEPLGWVRHFLAPMADGEFHSGELTHPIGRCIFVFAGGTFEKYAKFEAEVLRPEQRTTKGADFLSRLRGYIDVVGPNPPGNSPVGPEQLMHRALLLHQFLKGSPVGDSASAEKDIDSGVLRAFLTIQKYRHGARSMEAIIDMSSLHQGGKYDRSCLPPESQLDLHVHAAEFLRIARYGRNEDWSVKWQVHHKVWHRTPTGRRGKKHSRR